MTAAGTAAGTGAGRAMARPARPAGQTNEVAGDGATAVTPGRTGITPPSVAVGAVSGSAGRKTPDAAATAATAATAASDESDRTQPTMPAFVALARETGRKPSALAPPSPPPAAAAVAEVADVAENGDSPTAPMLRRGQWIPPTPVGPEPVSPVGASAGGLAASALGARRHWPPQTTLAGWRRAVRRRAVPRGWRRTAGFGTGRLRPVGGGAGVPRASGADGGAGVSDRTGIGGGASVSGGATMTGGAAGATGVAGAAGSGGTAPMAGRAGRPLVPVLPVLPGSAASSGSLVALAVGVLVAALATLGLLTAEGVLDAGWRGRTGFVTCALVSTALCLLVVRGQSALRRFRGRDELTGLVGRRPFLDIAARVVGGGEHRVREVTPVALVLVDLDRFREINGILGHESGDRLLDVVARRLRVLLQPPDLAARIGSDEFAVLLRDAGPGRAELLAGRLREALRLPVMLADVPVQIEVSIGIAYAPAHGRSAAELLRHAEAAMYEAKRTRVGQRTYQRGRHAPSSPGRAKLRLRSELRGALEQDQIELRYQPKADPRTGRVTGLEALVRWQHPREGLRGPGVFLREMEHAGLMPQLTRRVLDLALADCARWHAAGAALSVSVNVPPSMIGDAGFVDVVREALRRHQLAPKALVVEVTEEALITAKEQAGRTLADLRELGVRVSLDDYGTGFCSLAYLRELPADEVKLDQIFLRDMHRDPSAAEIVRSTVALAHALDLRIVAEGVETKAAWRTLAGWRCDEVQGYFISPPLAGGRVVAWLDDWARRVSRQSQVKDAPAGQEGRHTGGLEASAQAARQDQVGERGQATEAAPSSGLATAAAAGDRTVSPWLPAQPTGRNVQLSSPRPAAAIYSAPCAAARAAEPVRHVHRRSRIV